MSNIDFERLRKHHARKRPQHERRFQVSMFMYVQSLRRKGTVETEKRFVELLKAQAAAAPDHGGAPSRPVRRACTSCMPT